MKKAARINLALLLLPLLLWLVLLIILPLVDMFFTSITPQDQHGAKKFTLSFYLEFFQEPLYWLTFARTALMSLLATFITLVIAFPVAYYIAKYCRGKLKAVLFILCLMPFWVSELVRNYGWTILLRETGVMSYMAQFIGLSEQPIELLYNDISLMIGLVYTSLLFMVVPITTTLDSLDDSLIEANYDLGGNHYSLLRKVLIPHAMPGIVSGCIIVFMLTLGNYLTPVLLGGKESLWFTEQIYNQFITRFNWEQGSAFGFLLLILSSFLVWAGLKVTRQKLTQVMQ